MVQRVYPDRLYKPNVPLGYDGSDFYALFIDRQANGDWALRVSLPPDRAMSDVSLRYVAALGNHALTVRATYTVPSGKHALLQGVYAVIEIPDTTTVAGVAVTINDKEIFYHNVDMSTSIVDTTRDNDYNVWLTEGDVVKLATYNSTLTELTMGGVAHLREFDA